MDKKELTRRLARVSHRSCAQAADQLDVLLHGILKDLKRSRTSTPSNRAAALEMSARTVDDSRRGQ
ncbi:MAG: hypothetical protein ACRD4G_13030 [Bryobacteraceae bacterium]